MIKSKCINCEKLRPCIKIEARAPLAHGPVLVWSDVYHTHESVEYETYGPMVEICVECLRSPLMGTLAGYLADSLDD